MPEYGNPIRLEKHTMGNPQELESKLCQLSLKRGGAWVAIREGFSFVFRFEQFKNPSSVPDSLLDLTYNQIAYKGKVQKFTAGAQRRESQRGLRRD